MNFVPDMSYFNQDPNGLWIEIAFKPDSVFTIKHSLKGPAVAKSDGTLEWWIEGKQLTEEEFKKYLKMKAFW
jgi:hypothetical protein